jgi:hypothetical protein
MDKPKSTAKPAETQAPSREPNGPNCSARGSDSQTEAAARSGACRRGATSNLTMLQAIRGRIPKKGRPGRAEFRIARAAFHIQKGYIYLLDCLAEVKTLPPDLKAAEKETKPNTIYPNMSARLIAETLQELESHLGTHPRIPGKLAAPSAE